MYGTRMMRPAFIMPVPKPAMIWYPYWAPSIPWPVLIRDRRTTPIISRMAPASTSHIGGILGFPINDPATTLPSGMKAPNVSSLTAAASGERSLTVMNRCGTCATSTSWTVPARNVFLLLIRSVHPRLQLEHSQDHANAPPVLAYSPWEDWLRVRSARRRVPLPGEEGDGKRCASDEHPEDHSRIPSIALRSLL